MSGRGLIIVGLCSVVVGIGIAVWIANTLGDRHSPYEISPIDPQPVLEPWVEGQVTIDARDRTKWVYFDFSRGSVVEDIVRLDAPTWDLAFLRYRVATNSGTTHPNGFGGAIKLGKEEPFEAPEAGYEVDEWENSKSYNPAFRRWYRYSPLASGLVSRKYHYIVRTADHGYAKLQFLSYSCPGSLGGGAGCVTFRYGFRSDFSRRLEPPTP